MNYTLTTSERSPFGRICRMFMHTNNIPFQLRILNFVDDASDAKILEKESPINKVPILVDGDQTIFDSRVIMNHLIKKHNLPTLSMDEQNVVSTLYGCLDAMVILFLMKRDGFDLTKSKFFVRRNQQRLPSGLEYVTPWVAKLDAKNPKDWNYPSMTLYSLLDWAEKRVGALNVNDYPAMAAFKTQFANAPGVRDTKFD